MIEMEAVGWALVGWPENERVEVEREEGVKGSRMGTSGVGKGVREERGGGRES